MTINQLDMDAARARVVLEARNAEKRPGLRRDQGCAAGLPAAAAGEPATPLAGDPGEGVREALAGSPPKTFALASPLRLT